MITENILKTQNTHKRYFSEALDSRRVLLVEDNRSDAFLIKKSLQETFDGECNLEFMNVPRIVDALELFDTTSFSLILLDLNLLDSEGEASVSAIHARIPDVPIIVYSGTDNPELKRRALMCGARHYLVKSRESPFGLKFVIQQALNL